MSLLVTQVVRKEHLHLEAHSPDSLPKFTLEAIIKSLDDNIFPGSMHSQLMQLLFPKKLCTHRIKLEI